MQNPEYRAECGQRARTLLQRDLIRMRMDANLTQAELAARMEPVRATSAASRTEAVIPT